MSDFGGPVLLPKEHILEMMWCKSMTKCWRHKAKLLDHEIWVRLTWKLHEINHSVSLNQYLKYDQNPWNSVGNVQQNHWTMKYLSHPDSHEWPPLELYCLQNSTVSICGALKVYLLSTTHIIWNKHTQKHTHRVKAMKHF